MGEVTSDPDHSLPVDRYDDAARSRTNSTEGQMLGLHVGHTTRRSCRADQWQ
jgi:hypothetical protein